jgi:hypothetical protein
MVRKILMPCILLVSSCAFLGCGIEFIPILPQPIFIGTSIAAGTLQSYTDARHDVGGIGEILRGQEFYYKFYRIDAEPETGIESVFELEDKGYYRIMSGVNDTPSFVELPLVRIPNTPSTPRNDVVEVTLDFGDIDNPVVIAYDSENDPPWWPDFLPNYEDTSPHPIRRGVYDILDEFKGFSDLAVGDADLLHLAEEDILNPQNNLKLVVYALTFGKEDIATPIYSKPLYMLYVEPFNP